MPTDAKTLTRLQEQVKEIAAQNPNLSDDQAFVYWFFRAYLTEDDGQALHSVTSRSREKGADGILIDAKARSVSIVQAKYRKTLALKADTRAEVMLLASLAGSLVDEDSKAFAAFCNGLDAHTEGLLRTARRCVLSQDFALNLLYVSLGRVTKSVAEDATRAARRAHQSATFELLDGHRMGTLLRDYLDGAAPPIPGLDLELEARAGVRVKGVLERYDENNQIGCWVFSMQSKSVADLFSQAGPRLFARNIRGFMGDNTPVNRGMAQTLRNEPDRFFYYNNGITIVCDHAEYRSFKGKEIVRVSNPQVINGQQTSRMLALEGSDQVEASVLVKVIQIPRGGESGYSKFDELIGKVVQSTNWQNAIRTSDLMSNDRLQIEIEKELRKAGFFYLRKRQKKSEARRQMGNRRYEMVSKEELAQALAGCDLDPVVARSGKDNLFNEDNYLQVFRSTNVTDLLPKLMLAKEAARGAKSYPQRGYAKWLVLGFMWRRLHSLVKNGTIAMRFVDGLREQDRELTRPLEVAFGLAYRGAIHYFNANKGRGQKAIDISLFFRTKRGRHKEFEAHWARHLRSSSPRLNASIKRLEAALTRTTP